MNRTGWERFQRAVVKVVHVPADLDKQFAAQTLLDAGKVCGYETLKGVIGEIGVPKRPEQAGRVYRCAKQARRLRTQERQAA